MSTLYYALFHALCLCCANSLVGSHRDSLSQQAWSLAYRALEHGYARRQCDDVPAMREFPAEIREFALLFVDMQHERQRADYNPRSTFSRGYVMKRIDEAEAKLVRFEGAALSRRRAFAAWVVFRARRD